MTGPEYITPTGHVDEVTCWCGPVVDPIAGLMHTLDPLRERLAEALAMWDSDRAWRIADLLLPTVRAMVTEAREDGRAEVRDALQRGIADQVTGR